MKKLLFLLIATLLFSSYSFAKPFYISIRIGFFAKWDVVTGNCQAGNGICVSVGNKLSPDNAELGYDAETKDVLYLRISSKSTQIKLSPGENFELLSDSPVDPRLIKKFSAFKNPDNKIVYLKKGLYPIRQEGDSFVITFKYAM